MVRRVLRIGLAAVLTSLAAVIVLFIALASIPGQGGLLRIVEYAVSTEEGRVEIGSLDGSLLSSGEIRSLTLYDADGRWLEAKSIRFAWHPLALFRGRLDIDELTAEEILVERPAGGGNEGAEEADGGLPMIRMALDHVAVKRIILREPVLGEAVQLQAVARFNADDAPLTLAADLHIARLDVPGAMLSGELSYRPDDGTLKLHLNAEEAQGGIIAQLAQIPGQPALKLVVNGEGPLDRWRATWQIAANGRQIVQGDAAIDRADEGRAFAANMDGSLAELAPPAYAALLAGQTQAALRGRWLAGQSVEIHAVSLTNDALRLTGQGGADLQKASVHGDISLEAGREDGDAVTLPLDENRVVTLGGLRLALHLPKRDGSRSLSGKLAVEALEVQEGGQQSIAMSKATVSLTAIEPESESGFMPSRLSEIMLAANAEGLSSDDPAIAAALGPALDVKGKAALREGNLAVERLTATLESGVITANGTLDKTRFDGGVTASLPDLSRLSAIAGRDLGGNAEVTANIGVHIDSADLTLALDGRLKNAAIGSEIADRLLAGETVIMGGISRSGETLTFDELTLANPQLNLQIDGSTDMEGHALRLEALAHAVAIDPSLSGMMALTASLEGEGAGLQSSIMLEPRGMTIRGEALDDALVKFSGVGPLTAHSGKLLMQGLFDERALQGDGIVTLGDAGAVKLDQLAISFGSAKASGNVAFDGSAGIWGNLQVTAPDIAEFVAFGSGRLAGQAEAQLDIASWNDTIAIDVSGSGSDLSYGPSRIERAELSAKIADVANAPRLTGQLRLSQINHKQFALSALELKASDEGEHTAFTLEGDGRDLRFSSAGTIALMEQQTAIVLQATKLRMRGIDATLLNPAQIELAGGTAAITNMAISVGSGRIEFDGSAGETLDLHMVLTTFPANIANAFAPELAAQGTLDGSATVSGSTDAPQADYKISWKNISAAPLRQASLPPLDGHASGQFQRGTITTDAVITGQGINLKASGTVTPAGEGKLQLTVKGNVPLSLADVALASRGTRAEGDLQINLTAQGSFAAPKFAGDASLRDGKVSDPLSGVNLHAIAAAAKLSGGTLTLENVQAQSDGGGSLSGNGTIKQLLDGKPAADLSLAMRSLRIEHRNALKGEFNGDIRLIGDLNRQPSITGEIKIVTLEVPVPDQPPRSLDELDLQHVNPPASLRETLPELQKEEETAPAFNAKIDLAIDAGNRIFVRGRGLTAQLGGNLRIRGTSNAPTASGAFQLERGKLAILGRELEFTRGALHFAGSLDPYLDFAATTQIDNAQITILVSGRASDPQFRFTSSPDLPEDEILSRLLFNKSLAKLSAVQIAKLAAEVDKIGGLSGGPGVVDQLRGSLGVDVLDVTANEKGEASVTAGSYLQDNAYVGVEQGTGAESSRVIIDLDLTGNLKARGEVGANGESKLGVGMEWDY